MRAALQSVLALAAWALLWFGVASGSDGAFRLGALAAVLAFAGVVSGMRRAR